MRIKQGYKIRNIAGDHIVVSQGQLNTDLTKVIYLNNTSVELWKHFEEREFTEDKVTRYLIDTYNIDEELASKDAKRWIEALNKCGIL